MKISIGGEWKAFIGENEYKINVPSAIQNDFEIGKMYPSDAMPNGFLGTVTMKKNFDLNLLKSRTTITFKGVMPYATVYINDIYAGKIEYCQTSFTFDITNIVREGKNTIKVIIEEKNLELIGGMRFDVLKWSGIYDDVEIDTFDINISAPEIKYHRHKLIIKAKTDAVVDKAEVELLLKDNTVERVECAVKDGYISATFTTKNFKLWSVENPILYTAKITAMSCANKQQYEFNFGIREIKCKDNRIYINGNPFYAFGGGDEYFSPTISPLIDKTIIRKRFTMFKEMGFNFYRYHTHTPSQAELEVCDELGIFVSVEIPIISNFCRITDKEKGLEILENYIIQTRTHPCIFDYCMGNEGIQLLVKNKEEHKLASEGYDCIKRNTSYQLAMVCFGNQGEIPELQSDIMTPHLWSQEFRWAYNGLTKIPWNFLECALLNKPCIVHEFGKYGVWPDEREDSIMPENGYRLSVRAHNDELFGESGLAGLKHAIIQNSRKLSVLCAKTAFEAMRRQKSISGFVYWTFFRMGLRCGGLCDDMGVKADCEPELLRRSATAPLGIFADRDFIGRTFYGGEASTFKITLSNFSEIDVENGSVTCSLFDSEDIIWSNTQDNVKCMRGEIAEKTTVKIQFPACEEAKQFELKMKLEGDGTILCENSMTLWCYPCEKINSSNKIVYLMHNRNLADNLESSINNITEIWNWLSILVGCVIPEFGFIPSDDKICDYIDLAISKSKPALLICDLINDVSEMFTQYGIPVLYLDSGECERDIYPLNIPGNTFFSYNTFYAPFRTGWDEGNSATILEGDLFDKPSNDGFGDLRYYSCLQGVVPVLRNRIIKQLRLENINNTFRLIQRVKNRQEKNENSTVYFEKMQKKVLCDCAYYIDGTTNGIRVAFTTMKLFLDPCGQHLLKNIIENLLN